MTTSTNHFANVVRQKLIDNKLQGRKPDSLRGLARTMANGDVARAETFKRSLFKWMAEGGPNPTPANRALVAHALSCAADELDDEDSDLPTVAEHREMLEALHSALSIALRKVPA